MGIHDGVQLLVSESVEHKPLSSRRDSGPGLWDWFPPLKRWAKLFHAYGVRSLAGLGGTSLWGSSEVASGSLQHHLGVRLQSGEGFDLSHDPAGFLAVGDAVG